MFRVMFKDRRSANVRFEDVDELEFRHAMTTIEEMAAESGSEVILVQKIAQKEV